ncbi:MAG TPA: class I adenylate-forming enzyme family protein [Acidimicrobiia bacterium]|jgi:acyl-CoA synthetase (AMP-forming)/AMP-acid ligase II
MGEPPAPGVSFRPTVGDALQHAVAHWPDHDFVVTPERRMTYAQAEEESGRLARRMLAAGMGKGTRVGLLFPYGQDWVVAWLAASRIGALVMPLATTYRPAEIRKVLRIGDIDTLLTARMVLGRDMQDMLEAAVPGLADATGQRLFLVGAPSLRAVWLTGTSLPSGGDAAWATPFDLDADTDPDIDLGVTDELLRAVEAEVVPADLAQVTYTSGSSADPKGVVHTHGTVVRATTALGALQTADATPARVFCAFPFFWIGGTLVLGAALQSGATVLVTERFDPNAALDLIEAAQATHVLGWPTLLQAMRDHPSFAGRTLPVIPGLTVGPADVALVGGPVPGIPAHRGMSETVGNIGSVGYRVVDPDTGEDVPDGDEGELWVRGYGLMHGYYKQERGDVFDADGWFHTGDRVFLHDGRAWFVGRTTEMVKSRGANVSPREVELFLEEEFDEVLYAFVFGMAHPEFGEQVAAVLVPARGRTLDPDDIARRAREQISSYKVPTRIDVWDESDVPWLGSGKPDKRAIRERLEEPGR